MNELKRLRYKVFLTVLGLALSALPVLLRGGPWAIKLILAMPGSGIFAAGLLLFLLEFNRFRTYRRVLEPVSYLLLAAGGGMLCTAGTLLLMIKAIPGNGVLLFLLVGVPMTAVAVVLLVKFQRANAARKARKARKKR